MEDTMDVLAMAIAIYGYRNQLVVATEEMSELTKELCKWLRGEGHACNIAEEIADVEIMLAQLKKIFTCHAEVESQKKRKLERLAERIRSYG